MILDDDENECTLLMLACEEGAIETVKVLVAQGADVNAVDSEGDAVLVYAVENELEDAEEVELINVLLEHGAKVTPKIEQRLKESLEADLVNKEVVEHLQSHKDIGLRQR